MPPLDHMIHVYRELAEREAERGAAQMRDRFLILAADAALAAGQTEEAEQLRQQLLQVNPHHLIRPYESFADAMQAPEVYSYVADLRTTYAPEQAEQMLQAQRDGEPVEAVPGPAEGPTIYPLAPPQPEAKTTPKSRVTVLPEAAPPEPPRDEETPSFLNVWVPTGLFIIVLTVGLALAAYTLARPFVRW